ncbi:spore protease YyaC [Paenibacillus tarimensis]
MKPVWSDPGIGGIENRQSLHANKQFRGTGAKRTDGTGLAQFMAGIAARYPDKDEILFLCIGSDRSTGDAFGPLVGAKLAGQGWRYVIGTLNDPCDAKRLPQAIAGLPPDKTVIAVDACLGRPESVGAYLVADGPLVPAEALGANMPEVGNYSIAGVVNVFGPKPYAALQTTSLHAVMRMADTLAEAVFAAWFEADKFEGRG